MFRRFFWTKRPAPVSVAVADAEAETVIETIIPELPEEHPEKIKPVKTDTYPTS
jgi:hypothetical protein